MASNLFSEASLALFTRNVVPQPQATERNPKRKRSDDAEEVNELIEGDSSSSSLNNSPKAHQDSDNTVFVGNLPLSMDEKAVSRYFRECGEIQSVRLRSVPVEGTKVDEPGNQSLVKKVCKEQGKIGKQKGSLNAYVVFKDAASIQAALLKNNNVIDGRHIRVDSATPTLFDPARTLFIGNLPFLADEEELRSFLAEKLPGGDDDIEGVRLIRDQETLIGKGIAYVLLRSREVVINGLAINKEKFKDKYELRVSRYSTKPSPTSTKPKPSSSNSRPRHHDDQSSPHSSKKSRKEKSNKDFALRRLNLKKVVTKKKVLAARGQIKTKKDKKKADKK